METDIKALRVRYGLTQEQVARAAHISQPDVSAVERGLRRASPEMIEKLRKAINASVRPSLILEFHRDEVLAKLHEMGATNVRVFGSCLHGTDHPGSDVDLLVSVPDGTGLWAMWHMEEASEAILGVPVDLVSDDPRNPALDDVRAEALSL